jgi:hypothetical protein
MARPFLKSALPARNTRLLLKNAERRITLGVRFNMMPPYSGAKDLSTIRQPDSAHDVAPITAF